MQVKLGNWEARLTDRRISFEGGAIESATEARIFADMLMRWADAFDVANSKDGMLDYLIEQAGPELVKMFQNMAKESEARAAAYDASAGNRGRGGLN